jgi:hypothetical protein
MTLPPMARLNTTRENGQPHGNFGLAIAVHWSGAHRVGLALAAPYNSQRRIQLVDACDRLHTAARVGDVQAVGATWRCNQILQAHDRRAVQTHAVMAPISPKQVARMSEITPDEFQEKVESSTPFILTETPGLGLTQRGQLSLKRLLKLCGSHRPGLAATSTPDDGYVRDFARPAVSGAQAGLESMTLKKMVKEMRKSNASASVAGWSVGDCPTLARYAYRRQTYTFEGIL